jgi:endonuclease-3
MGTASNLSKAERIAYIDDRLQALYPETPVPLDHTDPYTLLIAGLTQRTMHR